MLIKNNSVPVVVLVSSQHGGIGIIRSLGKEGIPVYGVHRSGWEPAARSRFLRGVFCWDFSSASIVDSVSFLLDIAKQIGRRPILIPTSDITAPFLAKNARALAEGYLLVTPCADVVDIFCSKKQTSDLCQKLGIPTAATALPQSRDDALKFARMTKFPIIVKGEYGEFLHKRGRRVRVAIAANENELLGIFDLKRELTIPS
jgi:D-aspartate ligase